MDPQLESYTGNIDSEQRMPLGYRILFWVISFYLIGITLWVWFIAFQTAKIAKGTILFPIEEFSWLLLGYHFALLLVTTFGWIMQVAWQRTGTLALFPHAMVIGSLLLTVAAAKLTILMVGFKL